MENLRATLKRNSSGLPFRKQKGTPDNFVKNPIFYTLCKPQNLTIRHQLALGVLLALSIGRACPQGPARVAQVIEFGVDINGSWDNPSYSLKFQPSGQLTFTGWAFVKKLGPIKFHVSKVAYDSLRRKVVKANLFKYKDAYPAPVTDVGSFTLWCHIDQKSKSIELGSDDESLQPLYDLVDAMKSQVNIQKLIGTDKERMNGKRYDGKKIVPYEFALPNGGHPVDPKGKGN